MINKKQHGVNESQLASRVLFLLDFIFNDLLKRYVTALWGLNCEQHKGSCDELENKQISVNPFS